MLGTQLAQTGMGVVDTLVAGAAGTIDLAAVAVGASIWVPLVLFVAGVMVALTPLVAHAKGAKDKAASRTALQQGIWLSLLVGLSSSFLLLYVTMPLMQMMGVDEAIQVPTQEYLYYVAFGLPAVAIHQALRSYNESIGLTKPVTVFAIIGLILNIPLNYLFVLGWGPVEAMGGAGCGLATLIVFWVMAIALLLFTRFSRYHQNVKPLADFSAPNIKEILRIGSIGLPIGLAIFVEVSVFCVIALLIARLGPSIVAAHQIALSVSSLAFMVPLSLALALTVRVGHELGKGTLGDAQAAWINGLQINALFSIINACVVLLFRESIVGLYTDAPDVSALAVHLLLYFALYQFSDAIQVGAAGALRGYKDTMVTLAITVVSFWLIGLPVGYWLGLSQQAPMGAEGFWIGLVVGLTVNAILLLARLKWVSKQHRLQMA